MQVFLDYEAELHQLNPSFEIIEKQFLPEIAISVAAGDIEKVKQTLNLINLPDIYYFEVRSVDKRSIAKKGNRRKSRNIIKIFPVLQRTSGEGKTLGSLEVYVDQSALFERLLNKLWAIIFFQVIKISIVVFFILFIVKLFFLRPFEEISNYLEAAAEGRLDTPLVLKRVYLLGGKEDELGHLVVAVNKMKHNLDSAHKKLERELGYRKKMQAEMLELAHEVGVAEAATGAFHNVNNALTPIDFSVARILKVLSKAEMTVDEASMDKIDKELNRILKNMKVAKKIIKIQQYHAQVNKEFEKIDLSLLLKDVLIMQQSLLIRYKVQIHLDVDENSFVFGSVHQLCNVIINIFKNACEAMENRSDDKRNLWVSLRKNSEMSLLIVRDSGCGISEENLKNMFKRGFTTKDYGHGFGLHYCLISMKEMGGDLQVYSEGEDLGTSFKLQVPKFHSQMPEEQKSLAKEA